MTRRAGPESPIALLERWETFGGIWRSQPPACGAVVVELCSCDGEAIDQLRSGDPRLLRYLAARPSSDAAPPDTAHHS